MTNPEQENRLKNFATFFKGYMSVMPLITAALAPVLTMAKAIPVFESQKTSLATFSGLFGFLLVAWVFFARGTFAPLMTNSLTMAAAPDAYKPSFIQKWGKLVGPGLARTLVTMLPLLLIASSAYCYITYTQHLSETLHQIQGSVIVLPGGSLQGTKHSYKEVLQNAGFDEAIPGLTTLQVLYLGIFLCAELAFVFMALKEYAYGTLKISERDVLAGHLAAKSNGYQGAFDPALSDDAKPIARAVGRT